MSRIKRGRPSPAIVIAVLALVAALAGTAVAGPGATTSAQHKLTKQQKKQTKKISKKQVNKVLPIEGSNLASIRTETETGTVNAQQFVSLTPTCNENEKVIGGGYKWDQAPLNAPNLYVQSSRKNDNGWLAILLNRGAVNNRPVTGYAYCL